jgi:hypothetical protein
MNTTETNTAGTFETGTTNVGFTTTFYPNGITSISSAINGSFTEQLEVKEVGETIEIIYKETLSPNCCYTINFTSPPFPKERIFKIVYSCVDGKWNKSEPIYGNIVPAQEEYYDFDL